MRNSRPHRLHPPILATVATAAALAIAIAPAPARAGDYLQPAALTAKAEAIVLVDVELGGANKGKPSGKASGKPSIAVQRTLRGSAADVKPSASWLSPCLPDRKALEQWLRKFPKSPARKLWQEAASRSGYQAVVFLAAQPAARGGGLGPFCADEAMDLLHTDFHPEYGSYLKRIEALARSEPPQHRAFP